MEGRPKGDGEAETSCDVISVVRQRCEAEIEMSYSSDDDGVMTTTFAI